MNKLYKLTKEDAVILQNYCKEIQPILERYSYIDPDRPNFVTPVSRIKIFFQDFSDWVDIASHSNDN